MTDLSSACPALAATYSATIARRARMGVPVPPRVFVRRVIVDLPAPAPPEPGPPPISPEEQLAAARENGAQIGEQVMTYVCALFDVEREHLITDKRQASLVWPRQIAMWALANYTNYSTTVVGKVMGGRDHTTVVHARKVVNVVIAAQCVDVGDTWQSAVDALARFGRRPEAYASRGQVAE